MNHHAAAPANRSPVTCVSSEISEGCAPPRRPKRQSEQSNPADLVRVEYEEPSENRAPNPDSADSDETEFNEPTESDDPDGSPDPMP